MQGGNENDYVYPPDPINRVDLDGKCGLGNPFNPCDENHKGGTNIFSGAVGTVNDYANGSNDSNNLLVRGAQGLGGYIKSDVVTCRNSTFTRAAGALSLVPPVGGGSGVKEWGASAAGWLGFGVGNLITVATSPRRGTLALAGATRTIVSGGSRLSAYATGAATIYDLIRRPACVGR